MTVEDNEAGALTYSLSLKGEGITVEREVTADVARGIIAVVMGGGVGVEGRLSTRPTSSGITSDMSIREFIDAAGATKNPQIVAAVGLYLTDQEGQERFTRKDVKAKFSDAGEPTPANISRDVDLAKTSGWIAENPRNQFYVTDSGRRAIEAKFEGHAVRRPRRRSATGRRKPAKEG